MKSTYVSAHSCDTERSIHKSNFLVENVKTSWRVKPRGKLNLEICSVWALSPSYRRSHDWDILAERAHLLRVLENGHDICLLTPDELHSRLNNSLRLVQSSSIAVLAYKLFGKHKFSTFKSINPYELFQTFKITSVFT